MPDSNGKPYWWEDPGLNAGLDPGQLGQNPNNAPSANEAPGTSETQAFQNYGKNAANNAAGKISQFWSDINGSRAQNPNAGRIGEIPGAGLRGDSAAILSRGPTGDDQYQARNMQMSLIQQLQDQAAGRGPSLAQMQLQRGTDANMANAMGMAAGTRGASAAGMNKGIQNQQAGIAQGMAGDAAMLRLQEQMAARNALGQQLGGVRGQDQSFEGMDLQNRQFNSNLGTSNNQFYAGQANTMANSNAQRQADVQTAQAKLELEREKMLNEQARGNSPMGVIGGVFASMSDERLKTDIKPGESKLYDFLDKLGSHDYKYKDSKHGSPRISPMAQELEKSDLGKPFVFEAEDGKAVDYGKGLGTMLASQAALHKRLKKLEGK